MPLVSIVIRTLNEGQHLGELLSSISRLHLEAGIEAETVIIDSGSTDQTLAIASEYGCRVTTISKEEFTFGRSLNRGSDFARGEVLVYISGHCVPSDSNWLSKLISPLLQGDISYSYGRQQGRDTTKYSENKLFEKYYPKESKIPQTDFFCNNANAALRRAVWEQNKFDEEVTGLEDMDLGKRLLEQGGRLAYVADAVVFHIHNETWLQTKRRYEREAIALQKIMPDVHVSLLDSIRYLVASVVSDFTSAFAEGCFMKESLGIVRFRSAQYWGAYRGNHEHRKLSRRRKENYYYPNRVIRENHR